METIEWSIYEIWKLDARTIDKWHRSHYLILKRSGKTVYEVNICETYGKAVDWLEENKIDSWSEKLYYSL